MTTPRFAMRITEEILDFASQISGGDATDAFDDTPYIVMTPISADPLEINLKVMSEDQMFAAFKDDSNLHILN